MPTLRRVLAAKGPLAALDLNTYNFSFLMIGLLLHWRPRSFVRAVNDAVPAIGGRSDSISVLRGNLRDHHVFRAGRETGAFFCELFLDRIPIRCWSPIYSAFLGMFVPSGGSKWIIEAPYVLQAAKDFM